MGFEYALVHIKYTIPPAVLLSFLYRPLLTRIDIYKIVFLVTIAVVSTVPWDSYLIRTRIWTYPRNVITGPKLFDIPVEEVFFFIVQTYNTSLLYLLLSKPTFHPQHLCADSASNAAESRSSKLLRLRMWCGQILLALSLGYALRSIQLGGQGTYLGLIIAWAAPFLLLLWTLAYQLLVGLPWTNTVVPIALPTIYLWIVDTLALRRGTWVIEPGTKLGWHLWPGLEIEEAIFFLLTNTLIVFGQVAFDNALAVLHAFTPIEVAIPEWPSPLLLVRALLKPTSEYDAERLVGLREAVSRLRGKSRSFFLASGAFSGRLRVDLVILYSFCRAADDLIDEARPVQRAKEYCEKLDAYLHQCYGSRKPEKLEDVVRDQFSDAPRTHSAFFLLPTRHLPREPLQELVEGFRMDLQFQEQDKKRNRLFPITSEADLDLYASRVAGTVAQLCLELVFAHYATESASVDKSYLVRAGAQMGIALQYVNIARDIAVDATMGRVYVPTAWLLEEDLTPEAVLKNPKGARVDALRQRLLDKAFNIYEGARAAIEELPEPARGPMRVAVESYMEIGRVLRDNRYPIKAGRATVPKLRRIRVAWKALSGRGS